jgi:hypothetical protein
MRQKISNGSYLIVEPCVGFDGFGMDNVFSIDILENGNFYIQMKAKCCICESEITVSDVICPYILTTPTWVHHVACCNACGTSQLKKYRYCLEEETK